MTFKCASCGTENPDGSKYCNMCGKTLLVATPPLAKRWICPSCGASNPDYASFCFNCAKDLSQLRPTGSGRSCARCGAPVGSADMICGRCGCDPAGLESKRLEPTPRSKKPVIAGVVLVGSGILDIVSGVSLFTVNGQLPDVPIDFTGMLHTCGSLAIFFGIIALLGGWLSFVRKKYALALLAAALGMIGLGPFYLGAVLGFIGLILLALSNDEFSD